VPEDQEGQEERTVMRFLYIAGMVILVIIVIKALNIDVNMMFNNLLTFLKEVMKG
jgi:hypothetical protein